jgi:hypothetical protein
MLVKDRKAVLHVLNERRVIAPHMFKQFAKSMRLFRASGDKHLDGMTGTNKAGGTLLIRNGISNSRHGWSSLVALPGADSPSRDMSRHEARPAGMDPKLYHTAQEIRSAGAFSTRANWQSMSYTFNRYGREIPTIRSHVIIL